MTAIFKIKDLCMYTVKHRCILPIKHPTLQVQTQEIKKAHPITIRKVL